MAANSPAICRRRQIPFTLAVIAWRQLSELSLQGAILVYQRRDHRFDFGLGKAWRDMLRTVPVEGFDGEDDGALDASVIARVLQFGD
ncbi:MAG: hypothetical protein EXR70_02030 [Deltaproteobacteria bacterium]|nr:hypothetical protein [Deltaproteobacteria bacterium]